MNDLDTAITAHNALARLTDARVVEIGPQSNYATEKARLAAYRWAKRSGRTVTTRTERDPGNPYMSTLRVRLVEGQP